mgnify:CR=1 FL=1
MSGKEVEFVPLLVSALKQEGIAGRFRASPERRGYDRV